MKKTAILIAVIILCCVLCGCACEHVYDSGTITTWPTCTTEGELTVTCTECGEVHVEAIPLISHNYEETISKKATYKEEGEALFTCSACGDSYTEVIPMVEADVIVTVFEKESIAKDASKWIFSDYVRLGVTVENISAKSIKGVQGVLHISDMFGDEFLKIKMDFTDKEIPSNGSITETELYFDVNQFFSEQLKFFNTDFDDLILEYEVTDVIFTN